MGRTNPCDGNKTYSVTVVVMLQTETTAPGLDWTERPAAQKIAIRSQNQFTI